MARESVAQELAPVTVIGLGPGPVGLVSLGAVEAIRRAGFALVRTREHPAFETLVEMGLALEPLDWVYQQAASLEEVYPRLAQVVLERAEQGPVVYAVPGHPLVGERSVELIRSQAAGLGIRVDVIPAVSSLDLALARLGLDPLDGIRIWDGQGVFKADPGCGSLFLQIDTRLRAGDLKLALLESLPSDHPVTLLQGLGTDRERVAEVELAELDRSDQFDHLTTIYVPPLPPERRPPGFPELVGLMARLRSPDGCPWDREQDHQSLRHCLLEECYEVLEAIEAGDPEGLRQELGDLLLQVLFHAQIAHERGDFGIAEVLEELYHKLVERHPHVFGGARLPDAEAVLHRWQEIKRAKNQSQSLLDGVPGTLPALAQAEQLQQRATRVGFDWPSLEGPLDKVQEELEELRQAEPDQREHEMGDLLFAVVNVGRHLGVDAEQALRAAANRFRERFRYIEQQAGDRLPGMSLDEMDRLWEESKKANSSQ